MDKSKIDGREILSFYRNKRVLVTGHTGFKGSWLCRILTGAGAQVTGYALAPAEGANLYQLSGISDRMESVTGDVRDLAHLKEVFAKAQPEIVFHLAAQPIVRTSYQEPVATYETNVMGTVHLCECVRLFPCVKSFLNVTTDKVYWNREWEWGYRESDPLDGYDPYSNSKSCSELVTHCYIRSFFDKTGVAASTARAGNVIGGGDFAADRIVPDCVRAVQEHRQIIVRNPHATRPFQHVLEPLKVYLMIAMAQYQDKKYAGSYNVGPEDRDCITTGELTELFCKSFGEGAGWTAQGDDGPHEANFLRLDCSKLKKVFGWRPCFTVEEAVEKAVEWYQIYLSQGDVCSCMDRQIAEVFGIQEG